jgi:hypothetical protein
MAKITSTRFAAYCIQNTGTGFTDFRRKKNKISKASLQRRITDAAFFEWGDSLNGSIF